MESCHRNYLGQNQVSNPNANQQEASATQFIDKIAQKQQYCEDKVTDHNKNNLLAMKQNTSDMLNVISELESGCSAMVCEEESPRSDNQVHEQYSPILSHARQLKQIQMVKNNEKKANKFQINLNKSNIFLKRGQASDRMGSDRMQSGRSDRKTAASARLASTRAEQDLYESSIIESARTAIDKLQNIVVKVQVEEEEKINA